MYVCSIIYSSNYTLATNVCTCMLVSYFVHAFVDVQVESLVVFLVAHLHNQHGAAKYASEVDCSHYVVQSITSVHSLYIKWEY